MRTFSIKKRGYLSLALSFAVLSILSVKLFIPDTNTKAATQTASQTVGPNSISMSSTDAVAINAIPTSEQTVYSGTNELNITNSCPSGATVTLTTNSNSDTAVANNLVRSGSDSLSKTIPATTGNSLVNNSWGYSINNGSNYYAVPAKDETPATIYDSSSATSSADTVNVKYGIKMDNNIPSGNYSNDVVYTVAVKPACLSYTLKWDLDGGTGKTGADYSDTQVTYGSTINLTDYTPTRANYTFTGWSNGSSTFAGNETLVNVNTENARTVTLTAQWEAVCSVAVGTTYNFNYNGTIQEFTAPCAGYYKLEVWGAQGGNGTGSYTGNLGGYGGYAVGITQLERNKKIYAVSGGKGTDWSSTYVDGGYNGGGYSRVSGAAGGGASHISTVSGLLQNLVAYKDTGGTNLSNEILIVAGGGGGWDGGIVSASVSGGGYIGVSPGNGVSAGSQTAPGTTDGFGSAVFGRGFQTTSTENTNGGGGGGWYGGGASAGGSGYIASPKLISGAGITKHMTCYSCSTSTADSTRTNSNTSVSSTATADYAKSGNGYARITYVGNSI